MREIQLHALAFNFGLVVIAQRYTCEVLRSANA